MSAPAPQTLPQYFLNRVQERPDDPAIGWIENGEVKWWTFREYHHAVESVSLTLRSYGFLPGEKAAILSTTRKEWNVFDVAVQAAWGVVVPVYPSYLPEEIQYIVNHSDSVVLAFEDVSQLDKIIPQIKQMPQLHLLVSFTPVPAEARARLASINGPTLLVIEDMIREAADLKRQNPASFAQAVDAQLPSDLATIVYTSGTTGQPKGAMIKQHAFAASFRAVAKTTAGTFLPTDTTLTFLPLSHIFGRQDAYMILICGWRMVFAESIDRIVDNIGLVKPTIMAAVPRIFEKIYSRITAQVEEGSKIKRQIFKWALNSSTSYHEKLAAGEKASRFDETMHKLAWKLVFSKIYERFGGRMRFFISGGASLSPQILLFLAHAGLTILEGYGLTESLSGITLNPKDDIVPGSVGKPIEDVQIKLGPDGEILIKCEGLFCGYYKNPEETAVTLVDGWLHTGDIGELSSKGHLTITDRKKDLIKTSGGKYIVPQKIEGLMKTTRYISQSVVVGEGHNYATALIGIEKERFKNVLHLLGLKDDCTVADIANANKTKYFIETDLEEVNRGLAKFETIKKFFIVPEEFTVENGILTPSLKVKKKVVMKRYEREIEALYA